MRLVRSPLWCAWCWARSGPVNEADLPPNATDTSACICTSARLAQEALSTGVQRAGDARISKAELPSANVTTPVPVHTGTGTQLARCQRCMCYRYAVPVADVARRPVQAVHAWHQWVAPRAAPSALLMHVSLKTPTTEGITAYRTARDNLTYARCNMPLRAVFAHGRPRRAHVPSSASDFNDWPSLKLCCAKQRVLEPWLGTGTK